MAELIDKDTSQPEVGSLGSNLKNLNVQDLAGKAREFARSNPGKVLGGLSALIIGAGMFANRGRRQ